MVASIPASFVFCGPGQPPAGGGTGTPFSFFGVLSRQRQTGLQEIEADFLPYAGRARTDSIDTPGGQSNAAGKAAAFYCRRLGLQAAQAVDPASRFRLLGIISVYIWSVNRSASLGG
ncbi:MAG: hypothetical protein MI806_10470 [Minwuiales bacterium]|nr:hypothetical protein [Minwuiales bacterium]